MPKRRQTDPPVSLQSLAQAAAGLSRTDKQELIAILQAMLALEEEESADPRLPEPLGHRGPKGGHGYYERKRIRGCGPYLYLRYWSGGKHRSVYLGKG